jgi:hypothetical protein
MGLFIKGQVLARFVRHRLITLTVPPSKENRLFVMKRGAVCC